MKQQQNRRALTVFGLLIFLAVYGFISDDDFHKRFDETKIIVYNCERVLDGVYVNISSEIYNKCSDPMRRNVIVKAYKE